MLLLQVGLKYYEDLKHPIPRPETAAAEAIVRQGVFELAEAWGAGDVDRTYAFATGSYCRGKPESSEWVLLIRARVPARGYCWCSLLQPGATVGATCLAWVQLVGTENWWGTC
jgi:hypothetical protein